MKNDFFDRKKRWSIYKDFILGYYLKPYISKTRFLNKPIAIIDCCAGPGKFRLDGNDGSPIIICKELKQWRDKFKTKIIGVFIEKRKKYYDELIKNIEAYKQFAVPVPGEFGNYIDRIAQLGDEYAIFLYIDPFGIKDLVFEEMIKIFSKVSNNKSVELLMNFNCCGFLRWGLKALNKNDIVGVDDDFFEENGENYDVAVLNKIANGDYWQAIIESDASFEDKEKEMMNQYLGQFSYFKYVCSFPVKEKYKNISKYHLIYGTRHEDGMILMNDTMYKAREKFLEDEFKKDMLFDIRPPKEEKDFKEFENLICTVVKERPYIKRRCIKLLTMQKGAFCRYSNSDYNQTIKKLLEENKLFKTKGKIEEVDFYIK